MGPKRRWHVAINSLEKQSVHGVGVHSMDVHYMGMHNVGMCSMGMLGEVVCTLGSVAQLVHVGVQKTCFSSAVKTVIFYAHLRKKIPNTYHKIIFKSELANTS
jgi:hypothetical protein